MMKNGGSKPPPYVDIYNVPSHQGEQASLSRAFYENVEVPRHEADEVFVRRM